MAKQTGPNPFIGRRGNLLGYRMAGGYYVRVISSLTAKRVRKDPAFKLTMQYAGLLGKASKIASAIYRLLPEQEHGFYRKLTGMAMHLLKQERTGEEAFEQLYNAFIQPVPPVEVFERDQVSNTQFPGTIFQTQVEALPKDQVFNNSFPNTAFHAAIGVSKRKRISNRSFPDELLRLLFSTSPDAQEMESASVADPPLSCADHPPS